jgi:hypothetical protein
VKRDSDFQGFGTRFALFCAEDQGFFMSTSLPKVVLSSLPHQPAVSRRARWHTLLAALGVMLLILEPCHAAHAASRLKDVVDFEGVRDNMLVGYGLVVGLNGTGDTLTNAPFTTRSLIGMLERLGINISSDTMKTKNVAAVMVTATLPPFSAQGAHIDVTVGTMGDAKSLQRFPAVSVLAAPAARPLQRACQHRAVLPMAPLLNVKSIFILLTSAQCVFPCAILILPRRAGWLMPSIST